MSEQQSNQNISSVFSREILEELKKLISQFSAIAVSTGAGFQFSPGGNLADSGTSRSETMNSLTKLMLDNFEAMLSSTGGMQKNMGLMEGGFASVVKMILQIIGSLSGGTGTGGGLFGSLFGTIFGLIGGPIGAAIGNGIGGMLGSLTVPRSIQMPGVNPSQIPVNGFTTGTPKTINQIIIKNPVTFSRAFEVEVRNQQMRGSIDL